MAAIDSVRVLLDYLNALADHYTRQHTDDYRVLYLDYRYVTLGELRDAIDQIEEGVTRFNELQQERNEPAQLKLVGYGAD